MVPEPPTVRVRPTGPTYGSRSGGREVEHPAELRFVTYLAPGIPLAFYEAVVDHARRKLGQRVSLSVESRVSGPVREGVDPFSRGEADVGFMCVASTPGAP